MIPEKQTVVRNEGSRKLIWSPELDSYFLSNKGIEKSIDLVLKRKREGFTDDKLFEGLKEDLIEDLKKLGFEREIKEIDNSLEDRLSAPLDVYFDYTYACNLKCSYCYNFNEDRSITMSNENIVNVLTQMAKNGVMRTHLAGGEPMINPTGFQTYLETAKELGMNFSVNSNGTILTDFLVDLIFSTKPITLTFSLDGPSVETHDKFRGKSSFMRTRINAKQFVQENKTRNKPIIVQYKTTHFPDTQFETYNQLIQLAIKDGMDRIQFHNPESSLDHQKGHYSKESVIRGYYQRLEWLEQLKKEYEKEITIWTPWNPLNGCRDIGLPGYRGCIGGQELVAIDANADLKPCLMNKYELGNLFSEWDGDFGRFWRESKRLLEFQEVVSNIDPNCTNCEAYSRCRGGRKSRTIVENREFQLEEPIELCHMQGYDPYCASDFLKRNQQKEFPKRRPDLNQTNNFKQIFVSHSL